MNYLNITSHKVACKVLKKNPANSKTTDQQLMDIANAMNSLTKFKASFKKPDQQKWRPYFYIIASGFRFSLSGSDIGDSLADAGSRLCYYFSTEAEADYFGKKFLSLHKKLYNGK